MCSTGLSAKYWGLSIRRQCMHCVPAKMSGVWQRKCNRASWERAMNFKRHLVSAIPTPLEDHHWVILPWSKGSQMFKRNKNNDEYYGHCDNTNFNIFTSLYVTFPFFTICRPCGLPGRTAGLCRPFWSWPEIWDSWDNISLRYNNHCY